MIYKAGRCRKSCMLECVEPSRVKVRGSGRLSRSTKTMPRTAVFMLATDFETRVVMTRSISPARKERCPPRHNMHDMHHKGSVHSILFDSNGNPMDSLFIMIILDGSMPSMQNARVASSTFPSQHVPKPPAQLKHPAASYKYPRDHIDESHYQCQKITPLLRHDEQDGLDVILEEDARYSVFCHFARLRRCRILICEECFGICLTQPVHDMRDFFSVCIHDRDQVEGRWLRDCSWV
jgi:hypothetical protein